MPTLQFYISLQNQNQRVTTQKWPHTVHFHWLFVEYYLLVNLDLPIE